MRGRGCIGLSTREGTRSWSAQSFLPTARIITVLLAFYQNWLD